MTCNGCGLANADSAKFCLQCGSPLPATAAPSQAGPGSFATPASVGPAASAPTFAPAATPAPKKFGTVPLVVVFMACSFAIAMASIAPPHGASPAEIFGYRVGQAFAMMAIPFLIAYPIVGARKRRNGQAFAAVFTVLLVFFIYSNWIQEMRSANHPENGYARRLMREATGQQPIANTGGQQGEMEALARSMIAEVPEINRRYNQRIAAADLTEIPHLFAASSFRDGETMKKMRTQLQTVMELDEGQEQELREWIENTRRRVQAANWSDDRKKGFLIGMEQGQGNMMPVRERMIAAEREWIQLAQSVYDYALDHQDGIQVRGGHLIIADEEVRAEFNLREQNAQEKAKIFDQEKRALSDFQARQMQQIGLNSEDMKKLQPDK